MLDYDQLIAYRNKQNIFAQFMGIKTTKMVKGFAEGELLIKPQYQNPIGSVHGGCLFSLADVIAGSAAASYGYKMTTLSSDFHFLAPAIGVKQLNATAQEIKHGKRVSVYELTIKSEDDHLIAQGTFTFFNLQEKIINSPD